MSEIIKGSEDENKKYCDSTLELEKGARMVYLMLGERMYTIREQRLYEPFWDTWTEYCMEFKDLSTSAISKIISVYEVFILEYKFTPEELANSGGWTKLYDILKHVHSKKDALKWLEMAETHSRQDLGKFLIEEETGVSMHECKHTKTYVVRICEDCGERTEVFET